MDTQETPKDKKLTGEELANFTDKYTKLTEATTEFLRIYNEVVENMLDLIKAAEEIKGCLASLKYE